jgi:DNA polymerase (family 10)
MSAATKLPYAQIYSKAARLVEARRPHCQRIEIAGSLRRERPAVGDIELVAVPYRNTDLFGVVYENRPTSLDRFLDSHSITFTKRGAKYQQFQYGSVKVDLFLPFAETWGSVFTIRTGSAEFTHWLVTAQSAGGAKPDEVSFNGGRLYAGGRLLLTPEEEDVFAAVGLAWVPPQERHGPLANPARVEPVWRFVE